MKDHALFVNGAGAQQGQGKGFCRNPPLRTATGGMVRQGKTETGFRGAVPDLAFDNRMPVVRDFSDLVIGLDICFFHDTQMFYLYIGWGAKKSSVNDQISKNTLGRNTFYFFPTLNNG